MRKYAAFADRYTLKHHDEHAGPLHRVHGVRAEIHDDLVELGRVTDHRHVGRIESALETHVSGQ